MTATTAPPVHEINVKEIEQLLARAQQGPMSAEDRELIWNMAMSYLRVSATLADKHATLAKLRKALFGSPSERLKDLCKGGDDGDDKPGASQVPPENAGESKNPKGTEGTDQPAKPDQPKKGHGRNGADAYQGAKKITVPLDSPKRGEACPCAGCNGRVYDLAEPSYLVRVTGQTPILASVYELERLRCNLCGKVYKANAPEGIGEEKYDASAASMIGLLRYGRGFPFYRLAGLQESLGIPLPTSTQWDIVAECAPKLMPVFAELVRQAAQSDLVHNDDTNMRIVDLHREQGAGTAADSEERGDEIKSTRTGVFTTGIIAIGKGRKIALFFSGPQHAGENLRDVLCQRAQDLSPPIQMCDGLSRNLPAELAVILSNCLAHARRKFVEVIDRFPIECEHVLVQLALIYGNDAKCKELGLTAEQRLVYHQTNSGLVMDTLKAWLQAQFDARKVEPNSGLGQAIRYLTKRWEQMTLFLRVPGAPLDNNACYAALGISDVMPTSQLCRVVRIRGQDSLRSRPLRDPRPARESA